MLQHKNKNKNHDLVVFYWDDESEDQEVVSFLRKQEMGLEESRQRKKQGSKNKEIANITKERNHTKRKKISNLRMSLEWFFLLSIVQRFEITMKPKFWHKFLRALRVVVIAEENVVVVLVG